MKEMYMQLPF